MSEATQAGGADALQIGDGQLTALAGIQAPDRATLFIGVQETAGAFKPDRDCLSITLPCGRTRSYATPADVPTESDPCDCGALAYPHWFIRYVGGAVPGGPVTLKIAPGGLLKAGPP